MAYVIECPKVMEPAPTYPDTAEIRQYGALCFRQDAIGGLSVLLITTRETKRWTIPKGWPIKGLKPHEVAQREAWEEAGAKGRAKRKPLGHFTYLKWLADDQAVPASVAVHVMEVKHMKKNFPERGERKLDWVSPAEAARMVAEPDLQALFRKLEFRYSR